MGNVIPWADIHPTIHSRAPFLGVVVIDPERQLCVSELVPLDPEQLASPEGGAAELVAVAQQAAAAVASAYRKQRQNRPAWLRVVPGDSAATVPTGEPSAPAPSRR